MEAKCRSQGWTTPMALWSRLWQGAAPGAVKPPSPPLRLTAQHPRHWALALAMAAAVGTALGDDQVLMRLGPDFDWARVAATDAKATRSESGSALKVSTGHKAAWPGITLRAPGGSWDLAEFAEVLLKVRNDGADRLTIYCRVDNDGADGKDHCVTDSTTVDPGATETFTVPLKRTSDDRLGGKLFGMRGYPVILGGSGTVDPRRITQLLVFLSQPTANHQFEIAQIRASGAYTPPTAGVADANPFFPCVDAFGQYRHKDWPGKVKSLADLAARREQEAADLAAHPSPKGWDRYGGWGSGPQLKATGFFRTEKVGAKWWLVDPDGRLFFSHGIDCVPGLDPTPIEEREEWFEDFPGKLPEFAGCFSRDYCLKGHYAGRTVRSFRFAAANLQTKYGPGWRDTLPALLQRRLRSWGLNTIGNWSDRVTRELRRSSYTEAIGSSGTRMIEGSDGYWGKFPDVFDPSFTNSLQTSMEGRRGTSAGDPWCIGFFSDNEMSWGNELSLGLAALKSPAGQPAKQRFLAALKAKYGEGSDAGGGITRLNQAWGTAYASWEALEQARQAPDEGKARQDLEAFYTVMAEAYFRAVRDAIRAVAPNQLYLGCRFAWGNARASAAAAKYCDVVSYNIYQHSVADFKFKGGADVPLLIGEFHFGALDRGMFHTGLVPTSSQEARAQAYKKYVLGALHHPQFVGCHWFQYTDEPLTGRVWDEENYQIGFVDVTDTPYPETIKACREVGDSLYGW